MLPGPVFSAELLTTARRPRYYVIRTLYGLVILAQVYLSYQSNIWRFGGGGNELSIREMADFSQTIFNGFAIVQALVVLLLTPALVGGAIADERQRKTLHYLLTSRLSGGEIILGKLAARLLQVVVLVALGLPVVSLLGLFGGIDFKLLLFSYAATFTTIYLLSTASILASVVSRRPREAISLIYVLELGWLFVPTLVMYLMPNAPPPWPEIAGWVNPALAWVAITSPFHWTSPMAYSGAGGIEAAVAWGMGLQLAYGTAFILVAAVRLRPSARNEGGRGRLATRMARLTGKRRWFPRPACGDDAMLWKEMYVSRTGGLTKAALATLGVALVGATGYAGYTFLAPAVEEIWHDGYFNYGQARSDFNLFLRGVSTAVYVLWFLGIASSASGVLSSEREEDQWTSLLSTPLSGSEILRAKMIGPVFGLRLVAYLLFLLWLVGLAVGSIHPFGLAACLIEFVVFTWFLSALGTSFSLRSRNSTRSLASTMALLIFLNGGYLFCCIPFQPDSPAIAAGSTPYLFAISLLSPQEFRNLSSSYRTGELIASCILGVLGYGIAAAALTTSLFASFDSAVDRPDRFRQGKTAAQRREYLRNFEGKEVQFIEDLA